MQWHVSMKWKGKSLAKIKGKNPAVFLNLIYKKKHIGTFKNKLKNIQNMQYLPYFS